MTGHELWRSLGTGMVSLLGHLHEIPVGVDSTPHFFLDGALVFGACVWPILAATAMAGLLAGGIQSHFRTSPEALTVNWSRLDPLKGLRNLFSMRSSVPTAVAFFKLIVVVALSYNIIKSIAHDPIFYATVDVSRVGAFIANSSFNIVLRIIFALLVLAAADYGYQFWRTQRDLMMTKEELVEEAKNQEGNPRVKAARRRRQSTTQRRMLAEVPRADVIVANPTHLAVALRYDPKAMRAPRVVAKGARLNALRIREVAQQHQVPIVENKPLARLLFKHARIGGEIPAQLYAAVAEILAYVYRVNAYRYYREQQQR
jgi:flagellar biosynthetic protein FlhB